MFDIQKTIKKLRTDNKIQILSEYTKARNKHKLRCLICNHIWVSDIQSKLSNFKKNKTRGCPKCYKTTLQSNGNILKRLSDINISVLDEYTNSANKHMLKCDICHHTWNGVPYECIRSKKKYGTNGCSKCNYKNISFRMKNKNDIKYAHKKLTVSEWTEYKRLVHNLTRVLYRKHKNIINPNNLVRGKAGVEGAHHVDHIKPVRWCFDNGVAVNECANVNNLQMLPWKENVSLQDNIK